MTARRCVDSLSRRKWGGTLGEGGVGAPGGGYWEGGQRVGEGVLFECREMGVGAKSHACGYGLPGSPMRERLETFRG